MSFPNHSNKRQKREDYRKANRDNEPTELPKKKFYRQRAHANPFSDHQLTYPISPAHMDWSSHYPAYVAPASQEGDALGIRRLMKDITVADIGCGFGGLLVALSPLLPDDLILGLEIRTQVTTYVHHRIAALRSLHAPSPTPTPTPTASYQNISTHRTNTMKFLPNFFARSQLSHLFLCFPDPHFKARKHKMRIVSPMLLAEYAYVLRPGGMVWTITDVGDLAGWMRGCFQGAEGGVWEEVHVSGGAEGEGEGEGELVGVERKILAAVRMETEEGKKVERNEGEKFVGVWRRRADPVWPGEGI